MKTHHTFSSIARACSLLALLLLVAGCSGRRGWESVPQSHGASVHETSAGSAVTSTPLKKRPSGEVAPGYLVEVRSSDPKVNGEYRIEFDNTLQLPYDVRVNTAGLKEQALVNAIRQAYKPYFRSPNDIRVKIAKREYLVEAQGLVEKPGRYALRKGSSLDELISQAGGLNEGGPTNTPRYARIRGFGGSTTFIRLADYHAGASQDYEWQGGEIVFFQTDGPAGVGGGGDRRGSVKTVQVLGQVRVPAEYAAEKNADFFSYLIKAGGPTDRADLGSITVVRTAANGGSQAMTFDSFDVDSIPQIQPGDAIIVNADNPSQLEKRSRIGANWAGILSALGLVAVAAVGAN